MKVCVCIVFIVIQATTCEKAIAKLQRKLMVPEMNDACKKIKCASVEEPQCVRMRRHNLTLTIHVIAANKCELQYVKCHDDVEALIMPMKYCSHNTTLTAGKKITKTGKVHNRVKRQAEKLRDARNLNKTVNISLQTNIELPSKLSLNNKLPESEESTHFPMSSEESANYSLGMAEVDKAENDGVCPTVCPASDVKVCGKCQHGVYKTFSSICHLRMFSCNHNDEKLELISRQPCVFSAPYLSGRKMMPRGNITDHNDDDRSRRSMRSRHKRISSQETGGFPIESSSSEDQDGHQSDHVQDPLCKDSPLIRINIDKLFCIKCRK